jgi:hypothetical protein
MASVQSTAQVVAAEQAEFAAMLRTLSPEEWSTPSLCSKWSVRDVVIHTAAHIHNQQNDEAVISQFASCSEEVLVSWLETHRLPSRQSPTIGRAADLPRFNAAS